MDTKIKPNDLLNQKKANNTNTDNKELEKIIEGRRKLVNYAISREYTSMVLTGKDIKFFQDFDNFFANRIRRSKKTKFGQDAGAQPILDKLVKNLTEIVVARVSPDNKYKIVRMLQSLKHVTGATGRKLSDAQILKRADIGFATATSPMLTRECADILIHGVGAVKVKSSNEKKVSGEWKNIHQFCP